MLSELEYEALGQVSKLRGGGVFVLGGVKFLTDTKINKSRQPSCFAATMERGRMMTKRSVLFGPPGYCVATGLVSAARTTPASTRFSVRNASSRNGSFADGGSDPGNRRCHPFDCDTAPRGVLPPASG
jgi:hypothetical protein